MNHEVNVVKRISDVVKVTFKNVPLSVPDEEILHLCGVYGNVTENEVYRDQIKITTSKQKGFLLSPTRYVYMNLNAGSEFKNYYWLEGPMEGDIGRRITVLHSGQTQQCSNCFLNASTGCKGLGNGKACSDSGTPRAKMTSYMQAIKMETGYESLKSKYLRHLAKHSVGINAEPIYSASDMNKDKCNDDEEKESDVMIVPINPIVEKDRQIKELVDSVNDLQQQVSVIPELQKRLDESLKSNRQANAVTRQLSRRLSVSEKANEQKMVGLIKSGSNWSEDSAHLACSHAATLNDDDFELDDSGKVKPKDPNKNFMKKVESHLDKQDELQVDRFNQMKELILEQMKNTIRNKYGSGHIKLRV